MCDTGNTAQCQRYLPRGKYILDDRDLTKDDYLCWCSRCYYGSVCQRNTQVLSFTLESLFSSNLFSLSFLYCYFFMEWSIMSLPLLQFDEQNQDKILGRNYLYLQYDKQCLIVYLKYLSVSLKFCQLCILLERSISFNPWRCFNHKRMYVSCKSLNLGRCNPLFCIIKNERCLTYLIF